MLELLVNKLSKTILLIKALRINYILNKKIPQLNIIQMIIILLLIKLKAYSYNSLDNLTI